MPSTTMYPIHASNVVWLSIASHFFVVVVVAVGYVPTVSSLLSVTYVGSCHWFDVKYGMVPSMVAVVLAYDVSFFPAIVYFVAW